MRKGLFAGLMNRRTDAVSSANGKGAFVFRPGWPAADGPPAKLYGTKVVRSSQVSAARTRGTGTNLTYPVLGYLPDWRFRGGDALS